jgi:uncharacterized protein YjbI with pentapeptide repeats
LNPEQALFQGRLPGLVARAFVVHGHGPGGRFEELPTRLDTVHFMPGQAVAVCIWRGDTRISTDDGSDISQVMIAYERASDSRRSLEHYQEALRRRLDRKERSKLLLDERDLIPDGDKSGLAEMIERGVEDNGREGLLVENLRARVETERDKARARLVELGVDPGRIPAAAAPQKSINLADLDVAKVLADAHKQAEEARALAKERVAAMCKQAGVDPEEFMKKQAALPRFSAEQRQLQLQAAMASVPGAEGLIKQKGGLGDLSEKLRQAEAAFRQAYGMGAHVMVTGGLPANRQAGLAALKDDVLQRLRRGESLLRMDLAGVNLAGADLKGADLSECYLEFADFSGADLTGAKFRGAVAVHANFSGARLAGADFSSANVGKSSFMGAKGAGVGFADAVLSEASFEQSSLPGAKFTGGVVMKTNFAGADLSGAEFKKPLFMDCKFDGAKLTGAAVQRVTLVGGSAPGLDISGARGEVFLFVNVDLDRLRAVKAEIAKLRLIGEGTHARYADFSDARLPGSNLRGVDLEEANFERAMLDGADLSEAKLKRARFRGASAQRSHFMKTDLEAANLSNCNLKEAMLNKARLVQTDLTGSNCFGAEFLGVVVGETRFDGANLKRTKLKDWHP